MEISFIKTNPTENTTILVETPVPREKQPVVAATLMCPWSAGGEQVGFLEPATQPGCRARLQMMGGEFCGNAAMSLAAYLTEQDGRTDGEMLLEVSGSEAPVRCSVERRYNRYLGNVDMPLPEQIGELGDFPAVFFPGIVHLIVPIDRFTEKEAEKLARSLCRQNDLEAVGLMLVTEQGLYMRPCVYVAQTDSVTWEHGCASGTAALGVWHGLKRGYVDMPISQPGGTITAHCQTKNGVVTSLFISGYVSVTARGIAYL